MNTLALGMFLRPDCRPRDARPVKIANKVLTENERPLRLTGVWRRDRRGSSA